MFLLVKVHIRWLDGRKIAQQCVCHRDIRMANYIMTISPYYWWFEPYNQWVTPLFHNKSSKVKSSTHHYFALSYVSLYAYIYIHICIYIYTGWRFQPLWKIWKSVGMMAFPIDGKIKFMFQNLQPNIYIYIMWAKQNHKPPIWEW